MLMKRFLKQFHRYLYMIMVTFFFMLLYPFFYYASRKQSSYQTLNFFRKIFAKASSSCSGFFYKTNYETKIDWLKPYVICANHSSNLDVNALTIITEGNFFFLGKKELLSNLVTKLFFETIDIPINRENKIAAFRGFKKASERLSSGMSVIIFPEGKIGEEYPPVLHPFKNGAFRLAIEHQVPILPISIINNWQLMWDDGNKYGSKPGICHICVHKPIETKHLIVTDDEDLNQQVYAAIKSKLKYHL